MIHEAKVVIIGGGIVGASICYHLAEEGMEDIVLVDKSLIASGDTSRSAGSYRCQWSTEIRIKLAKEGIKFWREFAEKNNLTLHEYGYMFLLSTEEEREAFQRVVRKQNEIGIKSKMITPEEAEEIANGLNTDGILAGTFHGSDGYADESEYSLCCVRKARELGVKTYVQTEVEGIRVKNGKVKSVVTNAGEIKTPIIVAAAGPWSKKVMRMVGVDVPMEAVRCQVLICKPSRPEKISKPWIRDYHNNFYTRWDAGDLFWIGNGTEKFGSDPDTYKRNIDHDFLVKASKYLAYRFPKVGEASYVNAYAGQIQVTPDDHQIVGEAPQVKGLITAFGGSGCFAVWGVLGRAVAELIVYGKSKVVDISPLGIERFTTGNPLPSEVLLHPSSAKHA